MTHIRLPPLRQSSRKDISLCASLRAVSMDCSITSARVGGNGASVCADAGKMQNAKCKTQNNGNAFNMRVSPGSR
jgi:hypothetical protein